MRNALKLVCWVVGIVTFSVSDTLAQAWVAQTSGVSSTLACVSFSGIDTGSVCGVSGVILRTTNGGTTWTSQTSGTSNQLNWIRLFNAVTGTAVGNGGTIRRTTNGGSTWSSQTSGTTADLHEAFFVDASIAFIVGNSGTILKTTNAGSTWTAQTSGTTNDLNGVYFTSANNGVVIGESGTIRRTTNGGTSWAGVTSGSTNLLHEIRFWTTDTAVIVGVSGTVLRTTNAGATWSTMTSGTSSALVGLAVPDANTAIATGGSGLISRSTDRGVTWASQISGTGSGINEVTFPSALVGTVVGNGGLIRRTITGGEIIPLFSVSPASIAFGNVTVGQSKMDSVTVTNNGVATLTISSITSSNARFTVSPSSGSIAASGSQKFYITFSPTATGAQAGDIIFTHNAPGTPDTVTVNGTGAGSPGWSVSPTSKAFGNVVVGQSKMDSVTVTNTGTSTLTISAVTSNNARFTVSPSSGSIAASGTQKFYITFSPTATGAQAGDIIFTHNATGSPDTVTVTGTGTAPGWSVSPTSKAFGNVVVGQSKMDSVTVTNTGTSTLTVSAVTSNNARFTVSPASGSIAASGTQKFYITFNPTATGAQAGDIIFTHDATGSPDTVTVTGTGTAPGWSVSPTSKAFGNVVVGQSKMDSVTVTNTGTSTLTISAVTSNNARFTVSPSSGSIAASGTQKFYITFSPTATGAQAGDIIFTHDATGSPDTVTVTGTGVVPGWSVSPTSKAFGNVVVGQSKMDSVTVTNIGTSTLTISAVTSNNARFTVSPSSGSIAASGTQKFYITFSPTATGAEAGDVIFTHDATGSPDTVTVSGTGVAPGWSVSPTSKAFGNVVVGQSKMDSVTVTNTGTSTLTISGVTSNNAQFTVSPGSGSIAASGTQKFYITFSPTATGAQAGDIIFTHDATGSPDTVTVTGTGTAPGWSVSPTSKAFGNVVVGQSKMDSVTVTNTGTSTLTISAVTSNNARFTVSPSSGSVAASGTQKFYITFSPTATGAQAGSVIFTHDATGSPDTVTVTGTGTAPGWSVSPTSKAFGNVVVGQSKMDSVTVTNTGTSTLTISAVSSNNARFTVSPSSGSIAASGTQKFYITFSPTATGAQAGDVIFTHDATGSPDTVTVTGTGTAPGWSVSPTSKAFGNVVVGQSKVDSVTVSNTGTSTLTISAVTSNNARFTVSPSSGSIAASGTQKFYITFSPTATGAQAGDIVFTHNATGSPDTVTVTGTGVEPGFSVTPGSIDYADVVVGNSVLDSVTVTNTGTSTLTISSAISDNAEFTVSPTSATIPPSGMQSFHITFSPTNTGSEAGNIVFVHDAPALEALVTNDTVNVTGVGVAPGFSVNPTSNAFGNVVVGQSKLDSVTVTNTGTSSLTISAVTSNNARFTVSPASGSIPASGTQKFYVTFSPTATGAHAGDIIFTHDATGSPDTVTVTGTGVAPGWSVSPASKAFGNVVVGQSKMDSVTVTNTGTSTLTISAATSNNALFMISPGAGSIAPSGTQKFYITFSPTATGATAGDVLFTHDATGSPDTVTVSGTGVAPEFSASPTSVAFGNVVVGSSQLDSVTITNTGTSTLTVSAVTSDNARFTVSPGSGSIAPSGTQKFYITFSPTTTGGVSGSVIFVHDAPGSPDTIAVSGTGMQPGFLVNPATIAYGNVVTGQSKLDSVTVTNTGTSLLAISSVSSNNARFNVSPGSGSIAPSDTMKFYITFSPTVAAVESGDIIFMHDATGSPDTVTVSGTGILPTFTITASADSGGSITPSGPVNVTQGNNQNFVIAAATGYHIDSVVVDGANQGVITNYTFTNVTTNHSIAAYFSINVYTISASAGPNGAIAPSGLISVNHGSNQLFSITPNGGYHVDSVVVNGVNQGPLTSYNFINVTANQTIAAYFSITNFTITASATAGGSISPSGSIGVASGGSQVFVITPNSGYHIDSVRVDGANQGAITGYTFTNVTANHTIAAYFSINTYSILATSSANGSIAPSGAVTVNHGANQSFTITPNTGYHIDSVKVDGTHQGLITGYTFTNVTANHMIAAYFSINNYTITASVAGNGTITPSGSIPVVHGGSQGFTIAPDFYHHIDSVLVDGINLGMVSAYTFTNVVANHSITAFFTIDYITFVSMTPDTVYNADPFRQGRPKRPIKRGKHLMPNWTNLIDETVQQGGFAPGTSESDSAGGAVIGVSHMSRRSPNPINPKWAPARDSAKVRAWVRLSKWNFRRQIGTVSLSARGREFQKTLKDNTGKHTGPAGGFDSTTDARHIKLVKQQRRLYPRIHNNRLFAELVALKLNIAASQLGKTPAGYGDLIFNVDGNICDELSIMQISNKADSMMTYWQSHTQIEYDSLYSAVSAVNRAFVCPLDTLSFQATDSFFVNGKLILRGSVEIADVPFLKLPLPFVPTRVSALNAEVDPGEESDLDDPDEDELEDEDGMPLAARLYQNFPNPFNPSTTIAFRLPEASQVTITIYDMLGREVRALVSGEEFDEGYQTIEFPAVGLASGVYFYRIETQGLEDDGLKMVETRKMVLLK